MFLGGSKNLLGRAVLGGALGLALGGGCRPEAAGQQCYERATLHGYDIKTNVGYFCDERTPIQRRFPEFEDTTRLLVILDEDGACPMCPAELDELFWQDFLDRVERQGLAEGEDPDCVNRGYAIEKACMTPDQLEGSCAYAVTIASHCALGDLIVPLEPSGPSPTGRDRSRP